MKRLALIALLSLGLAACQPSFEKGDNVRATVGKTLGDPCRIAIQVHSSPTSQVQSLVARLETPECQGVSK